MENYFKVSDNGQVEINWELLEVPTDLVSDVQSVISKMVSTGHELVTVEEFGSSLELYFKEEVCYQGELLFATYTTVDFNYLSGDVSFNTLGLSDIEKFGFRKVM